MRAALLLLACSHAAAYLFMVYSDPTCKEAAVGYISAFSDVCAPNASPFGLLYFNVDSGVVMGWDSPSCSMNLVIQAYDWLSSACASVLGFYPLSVRMVDATPTLSATGGASWVNYGTTPPSPCPPAGALDGQHVLINGCNEVNGLAFDVPSANVSIAKGMARVRLYASENCTGRPTTKFSAPLGTPNAPGNCTNTSKGVFSLSSLRPM